MSPIKASAAAAALAALMLTGGCALLSNPKPVQLYDFGAEASASPAETSGAPVQVALRGAEFPQASKGDRILGVTAGSEAAYIKGARWTSPAQILFVEGLENSFASQSGRVRIIGPGELTQVTRTLAVDVRTFEAQYEQEGASPVVQVTARARLLSYPERAVIAERTFSVNQPATENRISAIVSAFDVATRDIQTQIVGWTETSAR